MRIFDKFKYYVEILKIFNLCKLEIKKANKRGKTKNAYLLGAPYHSNMGDQAQSFCTAKWIEKNFIGYEIIIIDSRSLQLYDDYLLNQIKKYIKREDIIILHSGYHTTDLYLLEENLQRKVIKLFDNKKLVIFPQTVNYVSKIEEEKSKKIYNNHSCMTMLCRDEISYSKAQLLFPKVKTILFPDIVTTYIGKNHYSNDRKGILLCLRNDKESIFGDDEISSMKDNLSIIDKVEITDTTINENAYKIIKNREKYLYEIWNEFSKYKLVITDRYHGTIFSLVANTPVIVLASSDHKLKSGVKWFPNDFSEYVYFEEDVSRIVNKVNEIYDLELKYELPDYFCKEYYDKLIDLL